MGKMDNNLRRLAEKRVTQNPGEHRITLTEPSVFGAIKASISPRLTALVTSVIAVCVLIVAVAAAGGVPSDETDICIGKDTLELSAPASDGGVGRFDSVASVAEAQKSAVTDTAVEDCETADTDATSSRATSSRFTVTFAFYGKESVSCITGPETVSAIAEKAGVVFDENEMLNIDLDAVLTEDTTVSADTVTYGTASVTEAIAYDVEYVDVTSIPRGTTKTVENGENGERVVEYDCTYVNGVEVSRTEKTSYTSVYPKNKVVYRGVGGTFTGGDGVTRSYSYYIDVRATVYYTGGTCATGVPADESVIAVDPSVIPLGTQVYITGSYADIGVRTAADTGGSIKGNIIDICISPSSPLAGNFGFRSMRVYVLD